MEIVLDSVELYKAVKKYMKEEKGIEISSKINVRLDHSDNQIYVKVNTLEK